MSNSALSQDDVQAPQPFEDADHTIARLCHQLRTPLTSAMGFLQLALREARRHADTTETHHLEVVDQQLRRLAGLIDEVAVGTLASDH